MVSLASWIAVLLYFVPYALVFWRRARADRRLSSIALDVPVVFVVDILLVLVLALFLRLETATIASRVAWIVGAFAHWIAARRGPSPAWPRALGRREALTALLGVAAALAVSLPLSRTYMIWDRKWHSLLVSSMRGQSLPFHNGFDAGQVLHYHFSGDVHAVMLQALSGGTIHSSFALTLSHDVIFGLMGLTLSLLLYATVSRGLLKILFIEVALLLCGPLTLGRAANGQSIEGYNVLNYLTMSFRPHDSIAGLLFVGFAGALFIRMYQRTTLRPLEGLAPLVIMTAGLAITDEASIGLLGLTLGLVWLVEPAVIHPRRAFGVLFFAALLLALIAPNVAFSASLGPGAQRHSIAIVPWRSPGNYTPVLPLTYPEGRRMLLFDLMPAALTWLSGLLVWLSHRCPKKRALLLFHSVILVISTCALTRIDLNKTPLESHRFMTAAIFLSPLFAAAMWRRPPFSRSKSGGRSRALVVASLRGAAILCFVVGSLGGVASTVNWIGRAPGRLPRPSYLLTKENLYNIDCRRDVGASFGASARYTYIDPSIWFAYVGCRPVYAPAQKGAKSQWEITINAPRFERDALEELHRRIPPEDSLPLICPKPEHEGLNVAGGAVCAYVRKLGVCQDISWRMQRCELSAPERAEALQKLPKTSNKAP